MYRLSISRQFIAQHYLIGGDWGDENRLHSHHYRVEVRIEGETLDPHGYLIDIVDLDRSLGALISRFRDRTLNEVPEFSGLNPSIERFAQIVWKALNDDLALAGKRLIIRVWENDTDWAEYAS